MKNVIVELMVIFLSAQSLCKSDSLLTIGIITDVHLEPRYNQNVSPDNRCLEGGKMISHTAPFGRKNCDSPLVLFLSALEKMKSLQKNIGLILVPGDLVTHFFCYEEDHPFNETLYKSIMETIRMFTSVIAREFPGIPIIFTEGNDDYLYDYQVPTETYKKMHYSSLYEVWITNVSANKAIADNERNQESFLNFGSYAADLKEGFRVISFNCFYFNKRNKKSNDPYTPDKLMKWIEDQLISAKRENKKVILLYHAPHGTYVQPPGEETFWEPEYESKFKGYLKEYRSTISAIFCGHTHGSFYQSFAVSSLNSEAKDKFYDLTTYAEEELETEYYSNVIINRAISPIFVNNPGFSLYYYKDTPNYPSSAEEYTFLLSETYNTQDEKPDKFWVYLFSTEKDLKMPDLSPKSIYEFRRSLIYNPEKLIQYILIQEGEKIFKLGSKDKIKSRINKACLRHSASVDETVSCVTKELESNSS